MKAREKELLIFYLVIDLFMVNFAIIVMAHVYFGLSAWEFKEVSTYLLHANLAWLITYFVFSKKNLHLQDHFFHRVLRITKRVVIFFLVGSIIAFIVIPRPYSRLFIFEYTFLFFSLEICFYFALYQYMHFKRENKLNIDNCLIIDSGETAQMLRTVVESNPILGYHFEGFLSDEDPAQVDVLGSTEELSDMIDKHDIHIVFAVLSLFSKSNRAKEYLKVCNRKGVRLFFVPENQRWLMNRVNWQSVGGIMIINPQELPLDDVALRAQKRLFDILFSLAIILCVFSWLFPIIAIIIKFQSRGPIFFVQKRTGINNKTFNCIKFRSMRVNKYSDEKQATADDKRITRIGGFMRKTNIDELPQFFNVLLGHMSVVGPRPHMLKHTDEYSHLIKDYMVRHYVKPGVTGWAQVNGYRGETNELWKMEKRVEYDMEYVEHWSFSWDLHIIWLTVFGKNVFTNAG